MNVNYINPFINACIEVFSTFTSLKSKPGKPVAMTQPGASGKIRSFIALTGHGIDGYFIIYFSSAFLEKILIHLFEIHSKPTLEELNDLAGELTNMITGVAKAQLSEKGFFFDVAVPEICLGILKIPANMAKIPVIRVPFETKMGAYAIEASIKTISADLDDDNRPKVPPPPGMLSVEEFSKKTKIHPIKIRRLLKTGFLSGKKISNQQWHISESELNKIQGYRHEPKQHIVADFKGEATLSVAEFSRVTGLSPAKVKAFIRSGFLTAAQDGSKDWRIPKNQASKFGKSL